MNKNKFAKIKCHNFYENNDVMNEYKALIKETTNFWYENKHTSVTKTEINLINSIKTSTCPYCGSSHIKKNGHRKDGVQTYCCNDCHKRFNPLTNTIFDNKWAMKDVNNEIMNANFSSVYVKTSKNSKTFSSVSLAKNVYINNCIHENFSN